MPPNFKSFELFREANRLKRLLISSLSASSAECTRPSHLQSLANVVANVNSQGISAKRTDFFAFPDPPTLAFLEKARVFPQKSKGVSLRGTPKILGKERKNARKSKGNRKTKKARKSKKKQGLEGQGFHSQTIRKTIRNA